MEPQLGVVTNSKAMGKRSLEWDLNLWGWDHDLLRATPLNPSPSDCRSRQLFPLEPELAVSAYVSSSGSEEANASDDNGIREFENLANLPDDEELNIEAVQLNVKLGEHIYQSVDADLDKCGGKIGKKSKSAGTIPFCQVEGCIADLSQAKDYHRRHKVCEVHSKVTVAVVGNIMQRFCQQCSRFHVLQEFDEGKRSCRRRLAGHNKRRRKTLPESPASTAPLIDETSAGQILSSLLRVLSSVHTNISDPSKEQNLLSQLLQNLADSSNRNNTSGLLQGSQSVRNMCDSNAVPAKDSLSFQTPAQATGSRDSQGGLLVRGNQCELPRIALVSQANVSHKSGCTMPTNGSAQEASVKWNSVGSIDLNNACNDDSLDCDQEQGNACATRTYLEEQNLPSPPQTSGNSASTSGRSRSSSGEVQCFTDRIVFKLFGKDPNDLPNGLRAQILNWLSLSPTEIEGYIRPGCIVLTLYVRLDNSMWEQFYYDMSSSLSRLLAMSNDPFWKSGWIYMKIQHQAAFICDGQVVLDIPMPLKSRRSRISRISPIAFPPAQTVQLVVKGSNLFGPTSGLLCGLEGTYLVQESCCGLAEGTDTGTEQDEVQSLSICFHVPDVVGRGFIEVEDYGLSGCFFPFIVAEPEVCSEICTLERQIEVIEDVEGQCGETDGQNHALDFVHEMGWLLHRNHIRLKSDHTESQLVLFPFKRLKWLVEFSIDHQWCGVLRKLMDLLFSGSVETKDYVSVEAAMSDLALLHIAVQKNSSLLVEFLLRYVPKKSSEEQNQPNFGGSNSMIFRPDATIAGGLTPLHVAASRADSENVLKALLEDPGMVGIEAWKNARDSTGLTPSDYASLRGYHNHIDLANKKMYPKSFGKHVVLDIASLPYLGSSQKQTENLNLSEFNSFYTEKSSIPPNCRLCKQNPEYYCSGGAPLTFRPAMLALVAIAVVCVCTALLFKSEPRVTGIFGTFRWEALKYGAM